MTDAKAIRNSVEGRDGDPFRDPADAIGRLRSVSRGPSATELHERTKYSVSRPNYAASETFGVSAPVPRVLPSDDRKESE